MRHAIPCLALAVLISACASSSAPDVAQRASGAAVSGRIGHVFIIILENENADTSFGPSSPAPYLSQTLVSLGAFAPNYYGTGHASLDNYISMVSGQAPNAETQGDCPFFNNVFPGVLIPDGSGQIFGQGCVYPASALTLADQMTAAGLTWRGYMEDMGNDLARDGSATCSHPALNSQDGTEAASAADNYATRHNPFMYFHSIIDDQAGCDAHVVPLPPLEQDLQGVATTPNFVFITPSLCHDGHDAPCVNGEPGGLVSIDAFLQEWVPKIVNSPAFQQDGLLIVTFDEASTSDATACCSEPMGFSTIAPGIGGAGGGRVGAVLLSSRIKPGTVSEVPYNHYSMLRSVEDIFGLAHLGYAGADGLAPFGDDIFTNK